ncbi:hypothetical protein [Virgibacillus doumboii]|uniref:hypothetical protein n=1 Tax=Virgibacillus doumboii TaxID=2697503 RepID=UPI0013DFFCC0|nr:hypothetical protein [Virgibacillus doumboii]
MEASRFEGVLACLRGVLARLGALLEHITVSHMAPTTASPNRFIKKFFGSSRKSTLYKN